MIYCLTVRLYQTKQYVSCFSDDMQEQTGYCNLGAAVGVSMPKFVTCWNSYPGSIAIACKLYGPHQSLHSSLGSLAEQMQSQYKDSSNIVFLVFMCMFFIFSHHFVLDIIAVLSLSYSSSLNIVYEHLNCLSIRVRKLMYNCQYEW